MLPKQSRMNSREDRPLICLLKIPAIRVRHVRHMGHFDICLFLGAVALELLLRHSLRSQRPYAPATSRSPACRIQTAVLGRHDRGNIQVVGRSPMATLTARTEVVRLLDQARHFRTAGTNRSSLRSSGALPFCTPTAAHFERLVGMLFRRKILVKNLKEKDLMEF